MKEPAYKQCRLERAVPNGTECQTTWLPAAFAFPGKVLRLKEKDGWQEDWRVAEVWPTPCTFKSEGRFESFVEMDSVVESMT